MRILTIETSTPVEEVAVVEDGTVLCSRRSRAGRGRADELVGAVAEVLRSSNASLSCLDGVAVSIGPGRFTGLRVGLATAKGLAAATGLRVVPVPTLEALAMSAGVAEGLVCPLLDARRGEVYAALFHLGGKRARLMPDLALAPERLAARVSVFAGGAPVLFVGTGADLHFSEIRAAFGESAVFAADVSMPAPTALAALAEGLRFEKSSPDGIEPIYLRGI